METPINISQDKYSVISKAILKVLTPEPIKFGELVTRVKKEVGNFPGSIGWYTVGILRELEKERRVIRTKGNPVTYHKT